jgi:tetratricopeptide (TPR) repeat protein
MSPAPSRLLSLLDTQISAASDPFLADCLRAERACYLARQGRFAEAKITLGSLRDRHDAEPRAALSAWLSLAEGLMSYFLDMGPRSRDRVLRAYAISGAAGLMPMYALSAAWLAHMDFARLDLESMALHVDQALKSAAPDHHSARSRASLVVAQALHTAGRMDLAAPWYGRTRAHALAVGDDAAISALMHNMAANRLDGLRAAKLTGRSDMAIGEYAMMGNESTAHFDQMIGASSLDALNPIRSAQIHSLLGEPARALLLYEEHMAAGLQQGLGRLQCDLLSDQAWCRVQLGQRDSARADALAAESHLIAETQIDDRAATHSRLALVYGALGERELANRHEKLAAETWEAFHQLQHRISELLGAMTERGNE